MTKENQMHVPDKAREAISLLMRVSDLFYGGEENAETVRMAIDLVGDWIDTPIDDKFQPVIMELSPEYRAELLDAIRQIVREEVQT